MNMAEQRLCQDIYDPQDNEAQESRRSLDSRPSINIPELGYLEETSAINSTLSKIGGNDRYFKLLMIQGSLNMLGLGLFLYSVGFLNSLPKFKCPVGPNGTFQYLPEVEACPIIDQCHLEYLYEGWIKTYSMICQNRQSRVFYVSLIFLINATVFFTLTSLADILGRNLVLKFSTFLAAGAAIAIWYIDSYPAKIISVGLVTGNTSVVQMLYTLGLKETAISGSNYNALMNASLNCAFTSSPIFVAFLAFFVNDSNSLSLLILSLLLLFSVGNLLIYNETPLYLYRKRRGKDFISKLFVLSKINSVTTSKKSILKQLIDDETKFRSNQKLVIDDKNVKRTVLNTETKKEEAIELQIIRKTPLKDEEQITPETQCSKCSKPTEKIGELREYCLCSAQQSLSQPSSDSEEAPQSQNLVWITVVLFYWTGSLYLINYGTVISIDKSGMDNLYANSVLLGIASVAGYGISLKFPKDVKRIKTISIIVICLLGLSTLILVLDVFAREYSTAKFLQSVCTVGIMPILTCMGFSVLYLYLPDVYPVTLRGLGIGVVICLGKICGGVSSSYLANFMIQLQLNPIAGCAVPSLILLGLLKTLPDF